MIKIEKVEKEEKIKIYNYPYLGKHCNLNVYGIVIDQKNVFVIASENDIDHSYVTDVFPCGRVINEIDTRLFDPVEGKYTLENISE